MKLQILFGVILLGLLLVGCIDSSSNTSRKQISSVEQPAICGNGIVETGEECDNTSCADKICNKCKCEERILREELIPPPLPE